MPVLLLLLTTTAALLAQSSNGLGCERRVCYFSDLAQYRNNSQSRFYTYDIDPALCSHIIYRSIKANDIYPVKVKNIRAEGVYKRVLELKNKQPNLKVLLELEHINYHNYIYIFNNVYQRGYFITNIISYLRKYKFDGFNLEMKFSGSINTDTRDPEVKQAVSDVIAAMRQRFDKEASGSKRLVFTVSVYGKRIIDNTIYDIPRISQNVDWIILLAYELNRDWYGATSHHSPLFADVSKGQRCSVDTLVKHWRNLRTPSQKIVIALPMFGRPYTLTGNQTGVGAPAKAGAAGPFIKDTGRLAYYEICSLIQAKGTTLHRITHQRVPYLVSGNQWVGYDDVHSVIDKIVYIKKRQLGGFAHYLSDFDDFKGEFCGQGKYPLLRAANKRCDE